MTKPTWIVQSNLISEDTLLDISNACLKRDIPCKGLKIIPFTNSPEFLADPFFQWPAGPLIPYGSTSLIKTFSKSKHNKDGFFFNEANLKTSVWIKHLGDRILNHDSLFMTLEEAFDLKEGSFFMKPDNDLKDFCGEIVTAGEIRKFYENVSAGGFCFGTDIPIVLSPVKNIGWEYRLFMIQDRVIAFSSYRLKSMICKEEPVPYGVVYFAEDTAKIWRPDDVYVMDVCETDSGYKIVEFNCFNASGFYNCNIGDIVKEVSNFVGNRPPLELRS